MEIYIYFLGGGGYKFFSIKSFLSLKICPEMLCLHLKNSINLFMTIMNIFHIIFALGIGIRLQLKDDTPEPQSSFLSTSVKRVGSELNKFEQSICQCGCKTCGLFLFVDDV